MPRELGNRLFTFAVVDDTHVNFGERECNSEFEINKRTARYVRVQGIQRGRTDLMFR